MGVEPKIVVNPPKMDGENNGSKPYEQMDDLGGFPPIFGNTHMLVFRGEKTPENKHFEPQE